MKIKQFWEAACVLGILTSLLIAPTFGQSNTRSPQGPSPQETQRQAVYAAQKAVNEVRARIAATRAAFESGFESKSDWIQAKKALDDAKAKYDAALKPVLDALHNDPEYQKVVAHRTQAQAKLDELRALPSAGSSDDQQKLDDELSAAAGDVINDGYTLNKMERDARDSDANVANAKEALDDAKKTYSDLQAQVDLVLKADPTYIQEQQDLANAQAALKSAVAALNPPPRQRATPTGGPGSSN